METKRIQVIQVHGEIITIIIQQIAIQMEIRDMYQEQVQNKTLVQVNIGKQIIYMTLLETFMSGLKRRAAPTSELAEVAATTFLALTVQLLAATASAFLPSSSATHGSRPTLIVQP